MNKVEIFNNLLNSYYINNEIKYDNHLIGTLSEKTLHKIVKNLYEENILYQEVKIDKYYVDVCKDNNIVEVQTKQFNKLRDKINYLLSLDQYNINIVYPVFSKKTIFNINNGIIEQPKLSPKKFRVPEVFHELYMIKNLLDNSKLTITLLVFEIDEYRTLTKNRKGYVCYDRIPKKLVNEIILKEKKDYLQLLPVELNPIFSSKELSKLTKTNVKYVNKMLNVLKFLDAIEVVGKDGRMLLYSVKKG